jgi:hypothetical protein
VKLALSVDQQRPVSGVPQPGGLGLIPAFTSTALAFAVARAITMLDAMSVIFIVSFIFFSSIAKLC